MRHAARGVLVAALGALVGTAQWRRVKPEIRKGKPGGPARSMRRAAGGVTPHGPS